MSEKKCYIIAGPNGAGKTTFAKDFLPKEGNCINFINADLIAAGLSPFAPENVSVMAGRLMIQEIAKCISESKSFALETTLSGSSYITKIQEWKSLGYEIILYYFSLPAVEMGIDRVKSRVEQGGHNIPEKVIRRRFERSQKNVETLFKPIVDIWVVFDTSSSIPILINNSTMNKSDYYAEIGMKAAKRAAKKTIENANREKRPIPIWEKGRIKHEIPSFSTCT